MFNKLLSKNLKLLRRFLVIGKSNQTVHGKSMSK